MTCLRDILNGIEIEKSLGDLDVDISALQFDSRKVEESDCFIAVKGTRVDGHRFIPFAIKNGAKAVVCEVIPGQLNEWVTYIKVGKSARVLGEMACNFYNRPSSRLKLIGITGTNGKTTTAYLIYKVLNQLGYKTGLISTIGDYIHDRFVEATHTTPDPIQINNLLQQMTEEECRFAVMEVSSHALAQDRVAGLTFGAGIFTNLSHDHLDYHGTIKEYIRAKKKLFDGLEKQTVGLYNTDDKYGKIMMQNCRANVRSYGMKSLADYKCKIIENHFDGMHLRIHGEEVWTRFTGEFNAYNLLAVYAICNLLGAGKTEILTTLSNLNPVPGRFEVIISDREVMAIVDYAHTPDALRNVLKTINQIRNGNQQLITVVGAGGDRDKAKRPLMAGVAAEGSNKLILTSDNPRNENPGDIVEDMLGGITKEQKKKVISILDRREAIRTACFIAGKGDIILIAGKGHETYQEVKNVRHHFDDREVIREFFKAENNRS